jgi:4-azaleucine resistance transporter AzlC
VNASTERRPAATAITRAGVLRGMRDMLPVALLIAPMAMAFGVAATQQGLDAWVAILMSFLLNAGASQFAALELWTSPLPVLLIFTVTLAVNARHLVYGASLYPWLAPLPPFARYSVLGITNDASWAYAVQAQGRGATDAGLLLGASALLWVNWTAATILGTFFGAAIEDPRTYGLDVVMLAFFAASLVSLWTGPGDLKPWLAAALGALLALWLLPAGWHVLAGAFAGGVVGALVDDG